ncbi:MAG: trypsin-like peptidase domain-containing protein [Gemmatimonadales bacterium]|nr:trypsin-like peptidase domain-containing protein [Gemmatimonadales bacterium]
MTATRASRAALMVALLASAGACRRAESPPLQVSSSGATQRQAAAQSDPGLSRRTAIVTATDRVAPAVVSVNVTARQRVAPRSAWDMFFLPNGAEQVVQSFGTGFILRADGVIVTNQHVVAGAERIVVTLRDGRDAVARLVGEDPTTDIAVVKIDQTGLPTAAIGRSADLMTGEWVIALGNPYAYMLGNAEPTVTVGVVSALRRNILPSGGESGLYLDMIQTDAAINPGNSGGPLTNALGEVVGVNSSIFSSTGGSVGLGFAIPIERAVRVAEEILRSGAVRRAWVGLDVVGPSAMREWKSAGGVRISAVAPDGPAARAGLRAGDVLSQANGRPLRNYLDWEAVKLDLHVGDAVTVGVRTAAGVIERRIVTGDLPTVTAPKVTVLRDLQLITITPAIQAERQLQSAEGALIFRVTPAVASATGLQAGDVIVGFNRVRVRDAAQFAALLQALAPRQPFRLTFERGGVYNFTDLAF